MFPVELYVDGYGVLSVYLSSENDRDVLLNILRSITKQDVNESKIIAYG